MIKKIKEKESIRGVKIDALGNIKKTHCIFTLPGRKELDNFALKVEDLDSSNTIVKNAINSLNDFFTLIQL